MLLSQNSHKGSFKGLIILYLDTAALQNVQGENRIPG